MSVDKRVYIVSQTEALMKNSKGCWMFSNLERKMIYQEMCIRDSLYIMRVIRVSAGTDLCQLTMQVNDIQEYKDGIAMLTHGGPVFFDPVTETFSPLTDCLLYTSQCTVDQCAFVVAFYLIGSFRFFACDFVDHFVLQSRCV